MIRRSIILCSGAAAGSGSSTNALRFFLPPGEMPSILVSNLASVRRPVIKQMAVRACGVSGSSSNQLQQAGCSSSSVTATPDGTINAADLTDEEVTRCLRVLPHYVDLASSEHATAASIRNRARSRLFSSVSVRRNALRDLRKLLVQRGFVANAAEADALSLAEIRARFGREPAVRDFVLRFHRMFVTCVDSELSGRAAAVRHGQQQQ